MTKYIHLQWTHEYPDDPIDIYYEVQADNGVSRIVERYSNKKLIADTTENQTKLSPKYPCNCLCHGQFASDDRMSIEQLLDIDDEKMETSVSTKEQFEKLFQNSEMNSQLR